MGLGHKSQSALEYMMIYGWAILIIVVIAVALYSMGIFNPSSNVTVTVTGFSDLGSVAAQCTANGILRISLGDSTGYPINITSITAKDYSTGQESTFKPNSTVDSNPIIDVGGNYIFSILNVCPPSGSHYSISTTVNYTELGQLLPGPYQSAGTVYGTTSSFSLPGFVAKFSGPSAPSYDYQSVSSIYLANNSVVNRTLKSDNFTVSAWVNEIDTSEACEITLLGNWGEFRFGTAGSATSGPYAGFGGAENGIMFEFFNDTQGSINQYNYFGGDVSYGNWSYLAITYNGTFIDFYINGKMSGSAAFKSLNSSTAPNSFDSYSSFISYGDSGCGGELVGYLSDVMLYNASLTKSDISNFYKDGVTEPGLNKYSVSLWSLNVSAKDYFGNDNGKIYNVVFTSNYPSTGLS